MTKSAQTVTTEALRSGYHDDVGPIYRHVEELCFALRPEAQDARLLYKIAQHYDLPKPSVFKERERLRILHDALTKLGLTGEGLILRQQGGRYTAFYRTKHARRAEGDLRALFAPLFASPALNVTPELTGRRYQEFYACIRGKTARDQLVKSLPRQLIVPAAFERPKVKTFYGRSFKLLLPKVGTLPVSGVLYRPMKTRTPGRFKFELRCPASGPKRRLSPEATNRLLGFLRYLLRRAQITASRKPAIWTGVKASVDTSNPAIGGQAKTGQRGGRSRPHVL